MKFPLTRPDTMTSMAIAHVCLGCGKDLARLRAAIEPHYGLPIVRCPTCGLVCVRRRHPQWRVWRSIIRVGSSLAALVLQLAAALILAVMTIAFAGLILSTLTGEPPPIDRTSPRAMLLLAALVLAVSILNGVWLSAALGHVARRRAWIGWFLFLVSCLACLFVPFLMDGPSSMDLLLFTLFSMGAISFIAGMLVVGLAGVPLGNLILRFLTSYRRSRWRRRRMRLRLLRSGG